MSDELKIGETYRVRYPFVRAKVDTFDEDRVVEIDTWKPGAEFDDGDGEYFYGRSAPVAHGEGGMLLTVVSIHRPGKYPTRVFFTRKWEDPDGKEFGKGNLRMTTMAAFKRLLRGYRHQYDLDEPDDSPATTDALREEAKEAEK